MKRLFPLLFLLATLCLPASADSPTPDEAGKVFLKTWSLVQSQFYDPKLNGVDVEAVKEKYLPLLAAHPEDAVRLINESLGLLKASHTHLFRNDDPQYFELLDIFAYGGQEREIRRLFGGELPWYEGILARLDDGLVQAVVPGGPAEVAGLLPGDRILQADGQAFQAVDSFRGRAGKTVALRISRDGEERDVTVTPERIQPRQAFLKSISDSARVYEEPPYRLGYVRMWSYAGDAYQERLMEILTGKLRGTDGLVLDLRGSWGGASPDFASAFLSQTELRFKERRGKDVEMKVPGYPGPLMVLIDGSVSSGKEILAYNLQKSGRAQLVGSPTRRAVLAGGLNLLPDGYALYLAQADVTVDGKRLEGRGVLPDFWVPEEYQWEGAEDELVRNGKGQLLISLIRRDLKDRYFIDQLPRTQPGTRDADLDNQGWLQAIMEHQGWPRRSLFGEDAQTAWLIAQHSDNDTELQQQALKMLTEVVKKGEAPAKEEAYLTDRVRVNQGQLQIYGTQVRRENGKVVLYEVEDPEHLDERRKSVGLGPEAEYLKGFER